MSRQNRSPRDGALARHLVVMNNSGSSLPQVQIPCTVAFVTLGALVALCFAPPLLSQIDLSAAVAFEAVSVKQGRSTEPARGRVAPERFTANNMSVLRLLQTAFEVQEDRILKAPGWARTDGYDIVAKAPTGVQIGPNLAPMLRALLKDRFGLTVHVEMREMSIYELVLSHRDGKLGPNLQRSGCDCREKAAARCPEGPPLKGMPELDGTACAFLAFKGRYIMRGYPMANLGKMLTSPAGRVVVDHTGLSGTWNGELEYTPDQDLANDPATPAGPSLPTAVEEQLGLRLQPGRGQVEVLAIDHLERPTEN
jgi:uncharacterized protein (TIGR03435 family)